MKRTPMILHFTQLLFIILICLTIKWSWWTKIAIVSTVPICPFFLLFFLFSFFLFFHGQFSVNIKLLFHLVLVLHNASLQHALECDGFTLRGVEQFPVGPAWEFSVHSLKDWVGASGCSCPGRNLELYVSSLTVEWWWGECVCLTVTIACIDSNWNVRCVRQCEKYYRTVSNGSW